MSNRIASSGDEDLLRRVARFDGDYEPRGYERVRARRLTLIGLLTTSLIGFCRLTQAGRWHLQRLDRRGAA